MKRRNSFSSLIVNRPAGIEVRAILQYARFNTSDLCEAYNRTGKFQRCAVNSMTFLLLQLRSTKILVDSTPVEKFVSQVVT